MSFLIFKTELRKINNDVVSVQKKQYMRYKCLFCKIPWLHASFSSVSKKLNTNTDQTSLPLMYMVFIYMMWLSTLNTALDFMQDISFQVVK